MLGWRGSRLGFVTPYDGEISLGPLGNTASRGAPEWSGGKDLYMGSHILATGKVLGFVDIVPGSFRKVPEGYKGVRKDPSSP